MCGTADSVRIISPVDGQQGEILPTASSWFSVVRWQDGSKSVIDKPNLCRLVEEKRE